MKAAAGAQEMTAYTQMALGLTSAVMGAIEISKGSDHRDYADKFKKDLTGFNKESLSNNGGSDMNSAGTKLNEHGHLTTEANALAKRVVNEGAGTGYGDLNELYNLNSKVTANPNDPNQKALYDQQVKARDEEISQKKAQALAQKVRAVGARAMGEQHQIANEATTAGMASIANGAAQMIAATAGLYAAKVNKDAAKTVERAEKTIPKFNFNPPPYQPLPLGNGDALGTRPPTAIAPGNTSDQGNSGADEAKDPDKNIGLGGPTGYEPPSNELAQTPPPGAVFKAGGPDGGGGGGGGGPSGGGSTSAANAPEENTTPRMADSRGAPPYEGGGGYRGGGAGGSGDKGPDLSGLLAQFLPKKDDENAKNGILDYGERGLASATAEDGSILGRNINIFERIHQAYQDKQKRRRVGI
jgi:hypothetical protein